MNILYKHTECPPLLQVRAMRDLLKSKLDQVEHELSTLFF